MSSVSVCFEVNCLVYEIGEYESFSDKTALERFLSLTQSQTVDGFESRISAISLKLSPLFLSSLACSVFVNISFVEINTDHWNNQLYFLIILTEQFCEPFIIL